MDAFGVRTICRRIDLFCESLWTSKQMKNNNIINLTGMVSWCANFFFFFFLRENLIFMTNHSKETEPATNAKALHAYSYIQTNKQTKLKHATKFSISIRHSQTLNALRSVENFSFPLSNVQSAENNIQTLCMFLNSMNDIQ